MVRISRYTSGSYLYAVRSENFNFIASFIRLPVQMVDQPRYWIVIRYFLISRLSDDFMHLDLPQIIMLIFLQTPV